MLPSGALVKGKRGELTEKPLPVWRSHVQRPHKRTCAWLGGEQEITVSMVWVTLPAGLFKKTSEWPRVSSWSLTPGSVLGTETLSEKRLPSRHALSLSLLSSQLGSQTDVPVSEASHISFFLFFLAHVSCEAPLCLLRESCIEWEPGWPRAVQQQHLRRWLSELWILDASRSEDA